MNHNFIHLGKNYSVKTEKIDDEYKVIIGDEIFKITDFEKRGNLILFRIDKKPFSLFFARDRERIYLTANGEYFVIEESKGSSFKDGAAAIEKGDSVSSPMPGLIVKIPVTVGKEVEKGETLAIVEAMKMQNELRSPRSGVVKKINFKEGEQIDALQPIVELE